MVKKRRSRSSGSQNAGKFFIILAFLVLVVFGLLGVNIENIFTPKAVATIKISPDCFGPVCDFQAIDTSVSFRTSSQLSIPELTFVPCLGPLGGIEIFIEFEVIESRFHEEKAGIRVCGTDPITTTFTFPITEGVCHNWIVTVGSKDNTGTKTQFYVLDGQECFA